MNKLFSLFFLICLNIKINGNYSKALDPVSLHHKTLQSDAVTTEKDFFNLWKTNPALLYMSLMQRKKDAQSSNDVFYLPEMLISILRIKKNIDEKLSLDSELRYLENTEIAQLTHFSIIFQSIIDNGIPYKKSIDTIFSYLKFMDGIFKRLCPSLPNSIAKLLTEEQFSNLKDEHNIILFFSFQPLSIDFFIKTRPAPLYIIGLLDYPTFENAHQAQINVDGYYTEIGGFAHHDAEHARADWKLDSHLLLHQNPEEIIQKWQNVRDLIMEKIQYLATHNPNLAKAAKILMFEILHERGLQFDLGILKSYLDLPLFSKTTKDKWKSSFWNPLPGKYELYNFFDPAENWLNKTISDLLIQENIKQYAHGHSMIYTIETISMKDGFVQQVEITQDDDINVWLSQGSDSSDLQHSELTSLYNIKTFGLIDVNPMDTSFITLSGKSHFLQTKFNQLLKLWNNNHKFSYKVIQPKTLILDKLIKIDKQNKTAIFTNDNEKYTLKLDSIVISNHQKQPVLKTRTLLHNNLYLPMASLGTDSLTHNSLVTGLKNGFQAIDTAKAYGNGNKFYYCLL